MHLKKISALTYFLIFTSLSFAQSWAPKKGTLMTRFAKDVNPDKVLPEYPRPQMVRSEWLNLNGLWQYQPGKSADEKLPTDKLSGKILVPFPVESALSGVMEHQDRLWYKRTFVIPKNWKEKRIILHFGAVDFESEVFINGKSVGVHKGGYDPFSYDITDQINKKGTQQIAVRVFDPTGKGGNPRGKQSLPGGDAIMYAPTSGIWQTVWLEPVTSISINSINLIPDIDRAVLKLKINSNAGSNAKAFITVKNGNTIVASLSGNINEEIIIPIPNQKLWSPEHPFLYDVTISLKHGETVVDKISSYFGMRKISVEEVGGFRKMFLNNKFAFQIGPLDQGFWPDGNYTAPTDEALKYDLEVIKKLGFNMVRKHIKVEPMRWYYWADKLGLMVWQDMPSANSYSENTPSVDTAQFAVELKRMVQSHSNSPSIIMWVIFNEAQGQHNTANLVKMVKDIDPTRLINQARGYDLKGVGDVYDIHSYPAPDYPSSTTQANALGEYGGIGYIIKNHVYPDGWGYKMAKDQQAYDDIYDDYAKDLIVYKTSNGLNAAVYTQLTDVEAELNGLMTYDREVIKSSLPKIQQSNADIIHANLKLTTIVPTSAQQASEWKYTNSITNNISWYSKNFDDSHWEKGEAGFGTNNGRFEKSVRTPWNSDDIWMRKKFSMQLSERDLENLVLSVGVHYGQYEVYINGVLASEGDGSTLDYGLSHINAIARKTLNADGENEIAIHCHQTRNAKFIDVGISLLTK